jgi:hypothetical protein
MPFAVDECQQHAVTRFPGEVDNFDASGDTIGQILGTRDHDDTRAPGPDSCRIARMSPGGHLVTTAAACATAAALTGSAELTVAIGAGGFLIDVDHAIDYVLFEGQRDLRPGVFLRYYLDGSVRRTVLVLHSYELFALLGALAWWMNAVPLWGYLAGAVMHLGLDLAFNGRYAPYSIVAFYSFGYRWAHGFRASALLGPRPPGLDVPCAFWAAFFSGAVARRPEPLLSPGATPPLGIERQTADSAEPA